MPDLDHEAESRPERLRGATARRGSSEQGSQLPGGAASQVAKAEVSVTAEAALPSGLR